MFLLRVLKLRKLLNLRKPKQTLINPKADGKPRTALITGASSGIGEAFARQLALEGYALILVARRQDRLTKLADELHQLYGVQIQVLAADLAQATEIEKVAQKIKQTENLSILINNAGFGFMGEFAETDLAKHLAMISVHITASVSLCHAALPGMLARKEGFLINVSSIAAFFPSHPTYSATKMFLNSFSEALQTELTDSNIRVQALCPGFTRTEFHDGPDFKAWNRSLIPSKMWMTPAEVVSESLKALETSQVICIPGAKNRQFVALTRLPFAATFQKIVRKGRKVLNQR